jgi:hypothetical protein
MGKSKTVPEPEVRAIALTDGTKREMKPFGGSDRDEWNSMAVTRLVTALPNGAQNSEVGNQVATAALAGLIDFKPADPVEAMIASQMIAANGASLESYRRAWITEQSFEVATRYLALADKAGRTVAALAESLTWYRARGKQTVVVQHVNVADGGQAVVAGSMTTGEGGGAHERR